MIINGRQMAEEIRSDLRGKLTGRKLRLVIISVGDNLVTAKYLALKQKFGEEIGAEIVVQEFASGISQAELAERLRQLADDWSVHGVVVQLPLPKHLKTGDLFSLIPPEKDVDALSPEARVLSPVVGAIKEILTQQKISPKEKKVVVVGRGKLVGRPAAVWLAQEGAEVSVVDLETPKPEKILKQADIIVSGAGCPGLITPNMIKQGTVLIDAATSELGGRLVGDVDPACAEKCAVLTPVPGGVGPLTIAYLFKNLVDLNL